MSQSGKIIDLRKGVFTRRSVSARTTREPDGPRGPSPLRMRRRKMRAIVAIIIFVSFAAGASGIIWASYLPQFTIQSIEVVGVGRVLPELISQYAEGVLDDGSRHIFSRRNIFLYPRAVIENAVEEYFPRIRSATVSRPTPFATTAIVTVEERAPYALWCPIGAAFDETNTKTSCYVLDDGGFIFADRDEATLPAMLYVFRGGVDSTDSPIGKLFVPGHLAGVITLLNFVGQAGFDPQEVTVDNAKDLLVTLGEGFVIKVSFVQDAHALVKNLQLVLSSDPLKTKKDQLEYIDLRFNNRVYYKLKGQAETTDTVQ